jgi:hypothetical protein
VVGLDLDDSRIVGLVGSSVAQTIPVLDYFHFNTALSRFSNGPHNLVILMIPTTMVSLSAVLMASCPPRLLESSSGRSACHVNGNLTVGYRLSAL